MKTSKTKVDVHDGSLTMEFDGDIVKYNIYDSMNYPGNENYVFTVTAIEPSMMHIHLKKDNQDGVNEL